MSLKKKAAIVGAYEHETRLSPDKGRYQIIAESAKQALDDAGIAKDEVDALFAYGASDMEALNLAEYLNMNPGYLDSTSEGGTSFLMHLNHAASALVAGQCSTALITYGATPRSGGVAIGTGALYETLRPMPDSFTYPFGMTLISNFAMVAQRHMHQYGTTPQQLAAVSVSTRDFASRNPHARYRDPITVEDVLSSPLIASPLHRLDCCLISDGAGAVVMTSAERARDLRKPPLYILGISESCVHSSGGNRDLTIVGAKKTGPEAFAMAGVTHNDIDVAQIYDAFTIVVIANLEDLGFCGKGEGGAFVEGGRIGRGGELPVNTDGGGLSSNQPGERGIFLIIEAARQLWGESVNQVDNAKIALCHGIGGAMDSHTAVTLILGRD